MGTALARFAYTDALRLVRRYLAAHPFLSALPHAQYGFPVYIV